MLVPVETQKKVLNISFAVKKSVENLFAGEYKSAFKGHGLEFEEVREYAPGDDIRSVDWKVSARYGKPFVKRFREERELTIVIMLDMSASLEFGTRKSKKDLAAEVTALLAWSAIANNDRIGMLLFSDEVEKYIAPKKGKNHILKLVNEVISHDVSGVQTDLKSAIEYLYKMMKKRAIVFIISDFLDSEYKDAFRILSRKHEVIPVTITDPWESDVDFRWDVNLQDSESGDSFVSSKKKRKEVSDSLKNMHKERDSFFKRTSVDHISLDTSRPCEEDLFKFFKLRAFRR